MEIVLNKEDREEAYIKFVLARIDIEEDEEIVVTMPSYSRDDAVVEIVKKQTPQEQPQE